MADDGDGQVGGVTGVGVVVAAGVGVEVDEMEGAAGTCGAGARSCAHAAAHNTRCVS